ncbi:MAG: DUF1810 domain-containing protein [Pseudomonadota bacterium]|nr:DUF1810 domain-containing protein [Pseudomonadota bacterium]
MAVPPEPIESPEPSCRAGGFDLQRFVAAQAPVYAQVLQELRIGAKRSHWMWFVFPQLQGLGQSAMARRYGIAGAAEARAYLGDAVLGARLLECTRLVLAVPGKSALQIFGSPDDVKLRSSMTLFGRVGAGEPAFDAVIERYFQGRPDQRTLDLL